MSPTKFLCCLSYCARARVYLIVCDWGRWCWEWGWRGFSQKVTSVPVAPRLSYRGRARSYLRYQLIVGHVHSILQEETATAIAQMLMLSQICIIDDLGSLVLVVLDRSLYLNDYWELEYTILKVAVVCHRPRRILQLLAMVSLCATHSYAEPFAFKETKNNPQMPSHKCHITLWLLAQLIR